MMESIDRIIFGDNQFFGINHMSQEKAQQLAEKFYNINNIYTIYDQAFSTGIKAVMLNSNDRASQICTHFRLHPEKYGHINWYPSIPYPHKYANMVSELGLISTLKNVLVKDNSTKSAFSMMAQGGGALFTKDLTRMIHLLVDVEMKMFSGLNVKTVFLQNIITDLILGFGLKELFVGYCNHVRNKYNALPGFITQNLPYLKSKLEDWKIEEVVLCSSFNKIGYLMSPNIQEYEDLVENNDRSKYQLMGMSTLASGAIPVKEAYDYIGQQNLQSVVFGASTKNHIEETVALIKKNRKHE
jgi:hypothetical protein